MRRLGYLAFLFLILMVPAASAGYEYDFLFLPSGLPIGAYPYPPRLIPWDQRCDHYVRGDRDRGLTSLGPVMYDRLGEGHFQTASTWPVPGISYTHAYLGSG